MISEGLAEPDDAYREATEILTSEAPNLSYAAVIVDEAQDMGEQAFRLIRAIVPENSDGDPNTIFIVGDAHQRIYARRASMSSCGINIRGARDVKASIARPMKLEPGAYPFLRASQ